MFSVNYFLFMLNGNSMYFYVFWELIYFYVICIYVIWETTLLCFLGINLFLCHLHLCHLGNHRREYPFINWARVLLQLLFALTG